jgi:hypothetical protein
MLSIVSTTTGLLAGLLTCGQLAAAHMELSFPPPFRSKVNPHATNIDYSMTAPLSNDGSNYPCKGYHKDVGTAAGASTATFAPGTTYNFTITGGAAHGGGSCQASLSYDGGATFTVIKSIIGGCPLSSNYDFTIPSDAQAGEAIFSWSWQNQLGNREFYQNCAPVTIGGGGKREIKERAAAYSSRPSIFLANIGNGCTTLESADVVYPDPGPDVQDNRGKQAPPVGSCGSAAAPGSGSGGGSGGGAPSTPSSSKVPEVPVPTVAPTTAVVTKPTAFPGKPTTLPGGVFITVSSSVSLSSSAVAEPTSPLVVAPVPTTLQTQPATKTTAAASAPTATAGSGSGSGSGSTTAGTACTNEGAWNCINGTAFQRCASGQWSAAIPMAAGTKCTPGTSDTLVMSGRRSVRRIRA